MGYQQNEKNGRRNVNGKGEKVKISLFIFPLPIYHHWQYRYKHESRTHQNLYKKKKTNQKGIFRKCTHWEAGDDGGNSIQYQTVMHSLGIHKILLEKRSYGQKFNSHTIASPRPYPVSWHLFYAYREKRILRACKKHFHQL